MHLIFYELKQCILISFYGCMYVIEYVCVTYIYIYEHATTGSYIKVTSLTKNCMHKRLYAWRNILAYIYAYTYVFLKIYVCMHLLLYIQLPAFSCMLSTANLQPFLNCVLLLSSSLFQFHSSLQCWLTILGRRRAHSR